MPKVKIVGLTLLTVFAMSAVLAATASAGVEALNAKGEFSAFTFKGTSEKRLARGILGQSSLWECGKTVTEGSIEAGGKLGSIHIALEKCKTGVGGTCTGLGDTAGTILTLGTFHLATNSTLTHGNILFLFAHLHFSCTVLFVTKLILVLGELLCEISPINVLAKTFTIKCEHGAEDGDPAVTSYENDKGEAATLTNALKSGEAEGTEEMASEDGELELEVTPEVKLDV